METSEMAGQLRKPEGENGKNIGNRMNALNYFITHFSYDLLNIADNDRVLEIGLGNGKFVPELMSRAKNIFFSGIDYSETMIDEAKFNNRELCEKGIVELHQAELKNIPYQKETFNKICTINTLYFWPDPPSDILEIHRVLVKGGLFVLAFRPEENLKTMAFSKFNFTLYSPEKAKNILIKGGFEILECLEEKEAPAIFNEMEINPESVFIVARKI